ncbi:MAG TPA: c-type cytochrome [Polyangia bacterium]|nr:c-type cytochrome [Polyangia bacterium]
MRRSSARGHAALALASTIVALLGVVAARAQPIKSLHTGGDPRLAPLHAFEEQRRRATDFRTLPTGDTATGPDPFLVRALPRAAAGEGEAERLVSILRGASEIVLLAYQPEPGKAEDGGGVGGGGGALRVVGRAPTPRAPTGLTVADGGDVFVSSELSPVIARYQVAGGELRPAGTLTVAGVHALRDVVAGARGVLYAADEIGGQLLTLRLDGGRGATDPLRAATQAATAVGHGPIHVAVVGQVLLVDCLLDHRVVAYRIGADGAPAGELARVQHDGPIWSFDAVAADAGHLWLVTGGVEDHPLDRSIGSFGYVDSFVTVYRLATDAAAPAPPERVAVTNVSALGVVTPKVIRANTAHDGGLRVVVTGYGTAPLLTLTWPAPGAQGDPAVAARELLPGTTSMAILSDGSLLFADPLLDGWVSATSAGARLVSAHDAMSPPPADTRDPLDRVGEALLFTTLMAPWNVSDGPRSRFTCETCHFEMYTDGRTHHTGRGDVHAVTKPLRGLFNNRPHFSRALDADLTSVANNEFRVAGARSDHDPWFTVSAGDFPWLRALGVTQPSLPPLTLRKALMTALMRLGHAPNPAATPGGHFTDLQLAGARLFRDRCESCHQARLASDDAGSRAPFAAWESLVLSATGPLVWGQAEYRQTGITPYVHESGARIPSLRRLYKKFPYFTNGSARSLTDLVTRARFDGASFWHDASPGGPAEQRLTRDEIDSLRAFLDLL